MKTSQLKTLLSALLMRALNTWSNITNILSKSEDLTSLTIGSGRTCNRASKNIRNTSKSMSGPESISSMIKDEQIKFTLLIEEYRFYLSLSRRKKMCPRTVAESQEEIDLIIEQLYCDLYLAIPTEFLVGLEEDINSRRVISTRQKFESENSEL